VSQLDLLIIGAGPAGMAAAVTARGHGLDVLVVDEQPAPGGQIWRGVEHVAVHAHALVLGQAYLEGAAAVAAFHACGARYAPATQVWQIEAGEQISGSQVPESQVLESQVSGWRVFVTCNGRARVIETKTLIMAGAQERPTPFIGWTLPGVLTVGAAQILLKSSGQIPAKPIWIAGSGPLVLLYMTQLLMAGGKIAGFLDTRPRSNIRAALPFLPRAMRRAGDLLKGIGWSLMLRRKGVRITRHVTNVEAIGTDRVEAIRYRDGRGSVHTMAADALLVHEGVVPNVHGALALGCAVQWRNDLDCHVPVLDSWGESSQPGVFIAGDGAGIAGVQAATLRGRICAWGAALRLARISQQNADAGTRPVRRQLARELALRPFLDAMFRPRASILSPSNDTIVCRCEEVTARDIRAAAAIGTPGPNQIKAFTRAGMGPCQGRQCAATVTCILAEVQNRPAAQVGLYRVRPPLRPVTLGELTSLYEDKPAP
jgi:thioredoxin reductase/bacterioferritin-associated ferredoxin